MTRGVGFAPVFASGFKVEAPKLARGSIASSSGSARVAPSPRSTVRRERGRWKSGFISFAAEAVAGHDRLDERAQGVVVLLHRDDGGLHARLIGKAELAAKRVGEELPREAGKKEVFLFQELLLQAFDAAEFIAVGHLRARVDRGITGLLPTVPARGLDFAVLAAGVEVFQGEA